MKKLFLLLFVVLAMLSCKNNQQKTESANPVEENTVVEETMPATLEKGCYVYNANGSTIKFDITETGETISGNLIYALAEKDSNTGTFKGQLKADVLIGIYTFQSEGIESTRAIAFKVDGKQLIEGYGELVVEGNSASFKDTNALNFTSAMPLNKTNCEQ